MLCCFFLTPDSACPLLHLLSVLPLQCTSAKLFLSFRHFIAKVGFPQILSVSPSMANDNAPNSSTVSLDVLSNLQLMLCTSLTTLNTFLRVNFFYKYFLSPKKYVVLLPWQRPLFLGLCLFVSILPFHPFVF